MHDQHPWVFWRLFEADYEAELRHAANDRLARQVLAIRAGGPAKLSPHRERSHLRQLFTSFTGDWWVLLRRRRRKPREPGSDDESGGWPCDHPLISTR